MRKHAGCVGGASRQNEFFFYPNSFQGFVNQNLASRRLMNREMVNFSDAVLDFAIFFFFFFLAPGLCVSC